MRPYIHTPQWAKTVQYVIMMGVYTLIVALGLLAIRDFSFPVELAGYTMILTGSLSVFSTVFRRYRFEWVSLSPMAAAVAILAVSREHWPLTVALWLVTFMLCSRLLELSLVASRLRHYDVSGNGDD